MAHSMRHAGYAKGKEATPEMMKSKKPAKMMTELTVRPGMDGGHSVTEHYSGGGMDYHEPKVTEFKGPHAKVSLPAGHILHAIAGHLGVPVGAADLEKAEESGGQDESTDE
jgi:hypothetical protein